MHELTVTSQKNTRRRAWSAGLIFFGLYLAWMIWGGGGQFERTYTGNLVMVFTGALAAWQSWSAAKNPKTLRLGRAWKFIGGGLAISLLGDLARFISNIYLPRAGFPAVTPYILYPLGTIFLAIGLYLFPRPARQSASRAMLLADTFITTTAALVLCWLMVFQPLMQSGISPITRGWVPLLFPLLDLALLLLVLNFFLLSDPRQVAAAFLWILAGLAVYTLSDLFYVSLISSEGYLTGSLVDLGWVLGDACFVLAAGAAQVRGPVHAASRGAGSLVDRTQKFLPVLLVVILGWYSLIFYQFNGGSNSLGLWVTVILGIALIIRQGISTGEQQFIQYASLVNSISEPAFVCDREGRLRMVNPAFLRIAGFSEAHEVLDTRLQRLLDETTSLPAYPQLRKEGWSGERELLSTSGEWIPVSLSLQPIQTGGDDRLSLAGTAHDLRELKKQQSDLRKAYDQIASAHDELEKMNEQLAGKVAEETANLNTALSRLEKQNRELQKLDKLKSDFVSLVSHELRAPLTNINGGIELVLTREGRLPSRTRESLELVLSETVRLTKFVETILDISALDAGRMPLTIAPLSLSRVMSTIRRQMTNLKDVKRVSWSIPAEMPELMADENALNSILFHLLDNAIKYAKEGQITVLAGVKGTRGWISVTDQGTGIPESAMPYLFDRFYRYNTEDDRDVYGHGMGLYIVKRLMEAMDGNIAVHNLPEGGAQFTCWLPLAEGEGTDDAG